MSHDYDASLVKQVVNQLVTSIVNQDPDNHYLAPQIALSKQHGVSRTIMREALSILISRRMLDARPKRGTRIRSPDEWLIVDHDVVAWRLRAAPDPDWIRSLIAFHEFIGPRAAGLAARHANRTGRAAISAAYQMLTRANSGAGSPAQAADALQAAIVDASGDALLTQLASIVRLGLHAATAMPGWEAYAISTSVMHYGQVVRAIDARDANAAQHAMIQLLADKAQPVKDCV
jgi:DNA-binding FadR family transcriptional regulator